jgi:hypothetical protein
MKCLCWVKQLAYHEDMKEYRKEVEAMEKDLPDVMD